MDLRSTIDHILMEKESIQDFLSATNIRAYDDNKTNQCNRWGDNRRLCQR